MFHSDLIFDVGAHRGEDTDYYLAKGFRVVAVEANPELAAALRNRFQKELASGRLAVEEVAIAKKSGVLKFYVNERSVWGTLDPNWAKRNKQWGASSRRIEVQAVPVQELLERHGIPYYAKIDIEGMDLVCLSGFADFEQRPYFVSVESNYMKSELLEEELRTLTALGFDQFQVVGQHMIRGSWAPIPSREGKEVEYKFDLEASGAFGADLGRSWQNPGSVRRKYRFLRRRAKLFGDHGLGFLPITRKVLFHIGIPQAWYDTHATSKATLERLGLR